MEFVSNFGFRYSNFPAQILLSAEFGRGMTCIDRITSKLSQTESDLVKHQNILNLPTPSSTER